MSELNPNPTCWSDSGMTVVEQAAMRRTAGMYPDGAYAAFVRMMDQGELNKRSEGTGRMSGDFYEAGKTYKASTGWEFRVDCITTHPEDGALVALGWRLWDGSWEPYVYEECDWNIYKSSRKVMGA